MLERQLLVLGLLFLVLPAVLLFFSSIVFGEEYEKIVPELLPVILRVLKQYVELHQVRYRYMEALQEHQGGHGYGKKARHNLYKVRILPLKALSGLKNRFPF